jgi:hypothetical protein
MTKDQMNRRDQIAKAIKKSGGADEPYAVATAQVLKKRG